MLPLSEYGDFSATFADVLLHPEACSVSLDVNSFQGNLHEPLLRMTVLMGQACTDCLALYLW